VNHVPDDRLIAEALTHITGECQGFLTTKVRACQSIEELWSHFAAYFLRDEERQLYNQFGTLQQSGQDPELFARKFRILYERIHPAGGDEVDMAFQFLNKLDNSLRTQILGSYPVPRLFNDIVGAAIQRYRYPFPGVVTQVKSTAPAVTAPIIETSPTILAPTTGKIQKKGAAPAQPDQAQDPLGQLDAKVEELKTLMTQELNFRSHCYGKCYNCGESDHLIAKCRKPLTAEGKARLQQVKSRYRKVNPTPTTTTSTSVKTDGGTAPMQVESTSGNGEKPQGSGAGSPAAV
jgi:hypothetical protein